MNQNTKTNKKPKFSFNCTKCGNCCSDRGPIPIVMDDLLIWAKSEIVSSVIPHLKFIRTDYGTLDLVLARKDGTNLDFLSNDKKKTQEDIDPSCPFYNKESKNCLIYKNRPLSCQTYPLEYDGSKYMVVDTENCPGIGKGSNTKEELKIMRNLAKKMNEKLKEMRITMPVLSQAMQPFVLQEIFKMQQDYMKEIENMNPEERKKFEQQMGDQMKNFKKG